MANANLWRVIIQYIMYELKAWSLNQAFNFLYGDVSTAQEWIKKQLT